MAYSKQTWDTSSYVNPTRMNHIEDGIEGVSNEIDNLDASNIPYDSNTSVKEKMQNIYKTEVVTGTCTVSPNGYADLDLEIPTHEGYTPVGMVQCIFNSASLFMVKSIIGTVNNKLCLRLTFSNRTASSSSISSGSFTVLYIKDIT